MALARDRDGRPVLRYNPSRSQAVEENASIARAVEHSGKTDVQALERIAEQQRPIKSRTVALELPPTVLGQDGGVKSFGRIGAKVYAEKRPLVEDLRAIAEKNTDSIFVIRDEQQVAFLAEKNLAPPPTVRVLEVRDTPSLVEHLSIATKSSGKNGPKSVIFFGESEAHVKALTLDLAADSSPRFNRMASELGARPSVQTEKFSGIVASDLKGRPSVTRGVSDGVTGWFRDILGRSAEIRPKESWSQLAVKDMDSTSVATVMKKAGWNTGQYGIPTAIKITFDRSPFAGSEEIDVVAGFSDSAGETAKGILLGAHKDVISSVPARGTSLLEYFMTLRNNLKALPDGKLKRLLLVIHDEHSKVLFTWIYLKTGTEKNA